MPRDPRYLRASGPPPPRRRPAPGPGSYGDRRPTGTHPGGGGGGKPPRPRYRPEEPQPAPEPHPSRRGHRRSWRQRIILTALTSILVLCLAGASVGGYVLVKYNSIDRVEDLDLAQPPAGEPENYLIVAVDTRDGQESRNTDTIMVARVDPQSDRLALTSFPRDLMVTIADTGEIEMINSAYDRPNNGEQNLIDTLNQNFGVPIHHFIEVNFESFKRVVDAIGGVSMWFPLPARDRSAGVYVDQPGCVQLDGQAALGLVRSRKMQVLTDDGWDTPPGESDLTRVQRQQAFIRRALGEVRSNPLRINEFVNIAIDNVRFDDRLGVSQLIDLGNQFRDFDPEKFETYGLPTVPYASNEKRVLLDTRAAAPMLNVFRGLPPGELSPDLATVQVLNATGKQGFARDVSGALQRIGFEVVEPGTTDPAATTTVQHAPGQANYGQLVAGYLTTTTDPYAIGEPPPGETCD